MEIFLFERFNQWITRALLKIIEDAEQALLTSYPGCQVCLEV